MKKKKGLLCLIMFFAALLLAPALQAQETIRGTLRSATGEAVAGATVTVKGTSNAVSSDNNEVFPLLLRLVAYSLSPLLALHQGR